jgi:DNA repair protein RecO (recombination protein O)
VSLVTLDAAVLRSQPWSESSRIVTFLAREQGLVKAMARGARGPKGRFGASLEPLQRVRITLSVRSTRELQTLTQADLLHPFARLREDLFRVTYAQALAELMARLVPAEQPAEEVFDLLLAALTTLEEGSGDPQLVFLAAQLHLAAVLGYALHTGACLECGSPLPAGGTFLTARGGLLCAGCRSSGEAGYPIGGETAALLGRLGAADAFAAAGALNPSRRARQESTRVLRRHLEYHTETDLALRSLRLAESLERYETPAPSKEGEGSR